MKFTPSSAPTLAAAALLVLSGCGPSGGGGDSIDGGPGGGPGADAAGDPDPDPDPDPNPDPGDRPDAGSCAEVMVEVTGSTPTVQIVVDRSGTMAAEFSGGLDRWDAVYQTLMGQSGVVPELQSDVRFGLTLYTGNEDSRLGTVGCPFLDSVDPALDNYDPMNAVYAPEEPLKNTPTKEGVDEAASILSGVSAEGPKAIVLATDGLPDTCEDPDADEAGGDRQDAAEVTAINAVTAAYDQGIETYVISVGDDVGEPHLQDVANAGAGLAVDGSDGDAQFYEALNAGELVAAFEEIIGGVRSCSYTLDGSIDPDQAAGNGTVTLDGTALQHGTEWELSDSSTLELLGSACDTVKAGGDHVVEARFTCNVIIE